MNTLIITALIVLAIGEIIFGGLCIVWLKKLEEATEEMREYKTLCSEVMKTNQKYTDAVAKDVIKYAEICDKAVAVMEQIHEQYNAVVESVRTLSDQHIKLLDCWKRIEERYSQTYEQFKICNDCMKKIMELLEPTKFDEIAEGLSELKELNGKFDEITNNGMLMTSGDDACPYLREEDHKCFIYGNNKHECNYSNNDYAYCSYYKEARGPIDWSTLT